MHFPRRFAFAQVCKAGASRAGQPSPWFPARRAAEAPGLGDGKPGGAKSVGGFLAGGRTALKPENVAPGSLSLFGPLHALRGFCRLTPTPRGRSHSMVWHLYPTFQIRDPVQSQAAVEALDIIILVEIYPAPGGGCGLDGVTKSKEINSGAERRKCEFVPERLRSQGGLACR